MKLATLLSESEGLLEHSSITESDYKSESSQENCTPSICSERDILSNETSEDRNHNISVFEYNDRQNLLGKENAVPNLLTCHDHK